MTSLLGEMTTLSTKCSELFNKKAITVCNLEEILSLEKDTINDWLRAHATKYVAHIHCFKGEDSVGQKLEGWSKKRFLVLRAYLMCIWGTKLENSDALSKNQALKTVIKLNLLAYWILHNSKNLLEDKNVTALVKYVKTNSLLLGLGYKSHAVYVLIEQERQRYIIRIYNTGSMSSAHSKCINQYIYPFLGHINSKCKLKYYIRGLLEGNSQEKRDAIARIYSPLLKPFMAQEIGSYRGTAYKAQAVGNCVLANHNAFIADFLSSQERLLKGFYKYELEHVSDLVHNAQNKLAASPEVRVKKLPPPKDIPAVLNRFLELLFLNLKNSLLETAPSSLLNIAKVTLNADPSSKKNRINRRIFSEFQILLNAAEEGRVSKKHSLLSIPSISEIISDKSIKNCRHIHRYFKFLKGVTLYFENTNASIFNSLHGWISDDYLPARCFSDFLLSKQSIYRKAGKKESGTAENLGAYFESLFLQLEKQYSIK